MDKTILDEFVEALNKAKKSTYTQIITNLLNTLKEDANNNYKDFKEHIDNKCDCNCAIKTYYELFGKVSDDELKEIIKENNITKDIFKNFDNILFNKFVSNNRKTRSIIENTCKRMNNIFDSNDKDKDKDKPLEDMTKKELINMIRNKFM